MNKKTIAITAEQYKTIIATMKQGFSGCRPNERIATALILEANLGLRISDIVKLRLTRGLGDVYKRQVLRNRDLQRQRLQYRPRPAALTAQFRRSHTKVYRHPAAGA